MHFYYYLCFAAILLCQTVCGLLNGASELSCGHPEHTETCFEDSVKTKLVFVELEPIVIRCVIRNLKNRVVTWMKNDADLIPLTIGSTAFSPDTRLSVDFSNADEWNLVIKQGQVKDSGEYFCQVNTPNGLLEKAFTVIVQRSKYQYSDSNPKSTNPGKPESNPSSTDIKKKNLMNDSPTHSAEATNLGSANVRIDGKRTVLSGDQFVSLTCTAVFRTRSAKANPDAKVEWYHQGIKQESEPNAMEIAMSWKDSDTVVSVLILYSTSFHHAGEWVCLKKPTENGYLETATHSLVVLESGYKEAQKESQKLAQSSLSFGILSKDSSCRRCSDVLVSLTLLFMYCMCRLL